MAAGDPPPVKRLRVEGRPPRTASNVVLRLTEEIIGSLNVQEILKYITFPELKFLTNDERRSLCSPGKPSEELCSEILHFLDLREESEREDGFRKFIACVNRASSHRGHKELAKYIKSKLDDEEWSLIKDIEEDSKTPLPSPYMTPQNSPLLVYHKVMSPEKPVALIALQGSLTEENFLHIESQLWMAFSRGNYDELEGLIVSVQSREEEFGTGCQVVALWFKSLVFMHCHKEYDSAIKVLDTALELTDCSDNENILEGRILQRKAQVCLMMGRKKQGAMYFKMAKEKLQFVGRGYDKTNMYCREAKMLSATEPERREDIEKKYENALSTLDKDDPYFLASFPSVTLSKVAFHLHFAFGLKLTPKDTIPVISSEDLQKARETLSGFNEDEHILIDMRRFEYDLIQAELCRLEGNDEEACSRFISIKQAAKRSKVGNISSIAAHRLNSIRPHS